jgi:hypothetical protein
MSYGFYLTPLTALGCLMFGRAATLFLAREERLAHDRVLLERAAHVLSEPAPLDTRLPR